MTREEARNAAEVMLAYADGKDIEILNFHGNRKDVIDPAFNWDKFIYRIKPKPTYRPFKDKEECWAEMQKHQPFGWVMDKNKKSYHNILQLTGVEDGYERSFKQVVFADETPFGIKKE